MNQEELPEDVRLRGILVRQIVTEKSKGPHATQNQWVLQVIREATKTDIKRAVEKLYKVNVTRVATLNVRAKSFSGRIKTRKGIRFFQSRRPNWKKAIVTLREGQRLPLV